LKISFTDKRNGFVTGRSGALNLSVDNKRYKTMITRNPMPFFFQQDWNSPHHK
jgi:hypothetical protein